MILKKKYGPIILKRYFRVQKKDNWKKKEKWKILGQTKTRFQLEKSRNMGDVKEKKKLQVFTIDGIPNETWIYGGAGLIDKPICIIGKVWDGEDIPEDWKSGIIVPLYKKGDPNEVTNYRGISLLSTAYKLYTEVIKRRSLKKVKEKMLLPEGASRF